MIFLWIAIAVVVVGLALVAGLVLPRRRAQQRTLPPRSTEVPPRAAEVEQPPLVAEVAAPPAPEIEPELEAEPGLETPEPTAGRLLRLRSRLARSQSGLGRGL
ncbi:MAG TPA: hypothetical protein VKQ07_06050, partial [Jatrophihabitantaceae bacterium]|nr:hypothetical protein [Jatrophihabitantaceae bacterium]